MTPEIRRIGYAGLGVMGEPIAANMLRKSGLPVTVTDLNPAPVARLVEMGATDAGSIGNLASSVDVLFLSLPGGEQVASVMRGEDGILARGRPGLIIVDQSTSPVDLTRDLAAEAQAKGMYYADAPVARTRQAAIDGTLAIMVGAHEQVFSIIGPLLTHAATDVTHCGDVGCGQVVKILNNMVLFETVVALSEALALGTAAGVDGDLLFRTLSTGSADSFALRNHGMKAMLPGNFPKGAFPTDYALKDVGYALRLAAYTGHHVPGAELAKARMEKARDAGFSAEYFPVLSRVVDTL